MRCLLAVSVASPFPCPPGRLSRRVPGHTRASARQAGRRPAAPRQPGTAGLAAHCPKTAAVHEDRTRHDVATDLGELYGHGVGPEHDFPHRSVLADVRPVVPVATGDREVPFTVNADVHTHSSLRWRVAAVASSALTLRARAFRAVLEPLTPILRSARLDADRLNDFTAQTPPPVQRIAQFCYARMTPKHRRPAWRSRSPDRPPPLGQYSRVQER